MARARRFGEPRLLVASHNAGKLREFEDLIGGHGIEVVGAAALDLPEPEETGDSFIANALLKAEAAVAATGLPALADDSGLAVAALDGAPGIYSARWAGPGRDFAQAMATVNARLGDAGDRAAAFVAVLALVWPDGHVESAEGRTEGRLVWPPRGNGGFGYDPMFQPDGESLTFGEMTSAAKHRLSHRARAIRALLARVFVDA